ncbi:MAG TPA: hypothetical protein PLC65_04655, partial [Bacteroidia bacterium]|nr:hypothetical protein [Bacteroidia bacterium]
FKINGSTDLYINSNGELVIKTPLGEITEKQPLAFQNGKKVKAKWVINNNIVSFEIGEYNHNSTLLIDPGVAVRNWGTYYGGSNSTYS